MNRALRITLVFLPLWGLYFWALLMQWCRRMVFRYGRRPWTMSAVLVLVRLQPSRETLQAIQSWAVR